MTKKEQKARHGTGTVYQYRIVYNDRKVINLWADSKEAAISGLLKLSPPREKVKVSKAEIISTLIYYTK